MRKFTEEMAGIIAELYEIYKTNPSVYEKSKLKYVERGYLKLIEQNPHKDSPYAVMKRQGYDVIQVLYKHFYVGVIINGVLYMYANKRLKKVADISNKADDNSRAAAYPPRENPFEKKLPRREPWTSPSGRRLSRRRRSVAAHLGKSR